MFSSLKLRLIVILSVSLILLTSAVAFVLERAFERSLTQQLNERMQTQLFMILTAAEEESPGNLFIPEVVRESIFNQIDSGFYAFAFDDQLSEVWRSFSAVDLHVELSKSMAPGEFYFQKIRFNQMNYFQLGYSVIWESEDNSEHQYSFLIYAESQLLNSTINEFRVTLWSWLGFVLTAMLVIQMLALRWGLRPLNQVADDLSRIESGKQRHLSDNYPKELKSLTHNLNMLIEAERHQRERYRNTLSNLAHSLKTPLAVLNGSVNELDKTFEKRALMSQQVERMNEIIQYQLNRAITANQGHRLSSVNCKIGLEKIIVALTKVYQGKAPNIVLHCDDSARFYGDEGDWMEIMGNIIDNACKWTVKQVEVTVLSDLSNDEYALSVKVEDDGPGIPVSNREAILQRGQKLDEQVEGQGIGMSVVAELIHQYGGSISVGESKMGGALFHIDFQLKRA